MGKSNVRSPEKNGPLHLAKKFEVVSMHIQESDENFMVSRLVIPVVSRPVVGITKLKVLPRKLQGSI